MEPMQELAVSAKEFPDDDAMHLQSWRCVQDSLISNIWDSQILEQIRPLCRTIGDFESS